MDPIFVCMDGSPATVTYIGTSTQEPNQATYTFSSQSIGTAAADRFCVFGVWGYETSGGTGGITSVVVDGNPAAQLVFVQSADGSCGFGLYGLTIAAGTTANVVINWANTRTKCSLAVWTITGLNSTTPTSTQSINTASTNPLSRTIDIAAGGCLIAIAGVQNTVATYSWTGATEDFDATAGTGSSSYGGASINLPAGDTGRSISVVITTAGSRQALAVAAFR